MDEILLKRIANHQMLHSSFSKNLGLMDGKMSMVLFFFHYAWHTGNVLYEDFAGELLGDIYNDIKTSTPWGFRDGLLGIGWGIEYLARQNFVECDTVDVLSEIDAKIMERDLYRIKDYSFDTGLDGLFWYVFMRLLNCPKRMQFLFDEKYLNSLKKVYMNDSDHKYSLGVSMWSDCLLGKHINYSPTDLLKEMAGSRESNHSFQSLSCLEGLKYML